LGRDRRPGRAAARRVVRAAAGWQASRDGGVLVVAIDGHGAAGKTTIAAAVAEDTGAALVHTDDFFDPPPGAQALIGYYDWGRLRAEALEPLRAGRRARFRRFDWERGRGLGGTMAVTPARLIVLEGVCSAAPELADLVDRSVYVDTPEPERLARLRARVAADEWDDDWLAAERAYFGATRPPGAFDLIVPGTRREGSRAVNIRAQPHGSSGAPG
jgi:uridine kinase